jgi:hypothetical protein
LKAPGFDPWSLSSEKLVSKFAFQIQLAPLRYGAVIPPEAQCGLQTRDGDGLATLGVRGGGRTAAGSLGEEKGPGEAAEAEEEEEEEEEELSAAVRGDAFLSQINIKKVTDMTRAKVSSLYKDAGFKRSSSAATGGNEPWLASGERRGAQSPSHARRGCTS